MREKTIARTIQIVGFSLICILVLTALAVTLKNPLVVGAVILLGGSAYALAWSSHRAHWDDDK